MVMNLNPTPEQILKISKGDPEIAAFITALLVQNRQQAEQIARLEIRVKELERKLGQNSNNSSKPPSSGGFDKPAPKSLRGKSGKSSGGQPGHTGHYFELTDHPDHTFISSVSSCACCHRPLADIPAIGAQRRQMIDLIVRMETTEFRAETVCCPDCSHINQADFPDEAPSYRIQYGNNLKAVVSYLNVQQLLPLERLGDFVEALTGHRISEGTIVNMNQALYEKLEAFETQAKAVLRSVPVLHSDETSMRVNGKNHWVHGCTDGQTVHYAVHVKRGKEGMDAAGILPGYRGNLVHDGWMSYFSYAECGHALCNTHHHRELNGIIENDQQQWPEKMIGLLYEIKGAVEQAKADGWNSLMPEHIAYFENRYEQVIRLGHSENPPPPPPPPDAPKKKGRVKQSKAKNLLDRIENRNAVLAFMYDFRIPFTNNEAERIVRMVKLQQKISGTFRSEKGAGVFCRIRSYVATLQRQKLPILEYIRRALEGQPFMPSFRTV
ncbi:IS66 family transposase [Paenibacillus sp. MZ04-78.2]|uniref:IS66 family transposase n=1 Tax=Paenibacillus sp. MZ04-78.2 TaxID=2962034 RepID=UPI0020B7CA8E|nr:IS66 family transposase [Paenibacillus sp. MZ04-78.2]MCP3775782.1 IS66 family transposase [Paenibacillus sp. MZ04-78.2]